MAYAYARTSWNDVERIAWEHFRVHAFRPGQRDLIDAVLAGRDAIGILPTGGGKSLCYQLPSLFLPKLWACSSVGGRLFCAARARLRLRAGEALSRGPHGLSIGLIHAFVRGSPASRRLGAGIRGPF